VGLCGFANDKFCLVSQSSSAQKNKKISETLRVPTTCLNICGTSLVGAFVAGNNHCILLPQIVFDSEIAILEKAKIPYKILETDYTALGNNLVANDKACLISPHLEHLKSQIKEYLNVEKIEVFTINDIPTIGALITLNDKGCYVSAMASDAEAQKIEEFFGIPVTRGTVNLGSSYVSSGLIVNNNGFIFGKSTGGPEAVAIDSALGFIE